MSTDVINVSIVDRLPLDILLEILSRLDAKTLAILSCVSKSLSALVSAPSFRRCHRSRQRPQLLLAMTERRSWCTIFVNLYSFDTKKGILEKKLSFNLNLEKIAPWVGFELPSVAFSCLELVCICDWITITTYLCNPTTREVLTLSGACAIAFDYLPSTKEYKALGMPDFPRNGWSDCKFCTFSTSNRTWKGVSDPPFNVTVSEERTSVATTNGYAHFLPLCYDYGRYGMQIARFDLEREEWSVLLTPTFYPTKDQNLNLSVLGGELCLVVSDITKSADIWLLKDYDNNVWVKAHTIDISSLYASYLPLQIIPLMIEEDGRVLMQVCYIDLDDFSAVENSLAIYDPRSTRLEEIDLRKNLRRHRRQQYDYGVLFQVGFYVDSSVSLREDNSSNLFSRRKRRRSQKSKH